MRVLSKEEFNNEVVVTLRSEVTEATMIELQEVVKTNDIAKTGIVIKFDDTNCAPVIYLQEFYEEYLETEDLESTIKRIISFVKRQRETSSVITDSTYNMISDFEAAKNKIMFKLINLDKNKEYLKDKPFAKYNNLAVVFYLFLNEDEKSNGEYIKSVNVTNKLMQQWGTDSATLLSVSIENTMKEFKFSLKSMRDLIFGFANNGYFDFEMEAELRRCARDMEDNEMMVLTNIQGINGAASILYPKVLKSIADELRCDIVILPSSIHEVILLKYREELDLVALQEMVQEINISSVDAVEVLSDTPYLYKRDIDKIEIFN